MEGLSLLTSVRETNSQTESRHWPQIYFGVAATSLATLLLELALTRVFSVVYFYHFAFLAISIALFGLGAGGVFSYVVEDWPGSLYRKLGILAAANAISVVLSLSYLLGRAGDLSLGAMGIVYLIAAIPFVLSGAIVSLAISDTIERVNRVYFFDLLGAAAGCALLVPLLDRLGGPNTILVSSVLLAVSAAIWFHLAHASSGRICAVLLGLLLVCLITYNVKSSLIDVRFAKGQRVAGEEFVRWNEFSRIALKKDPGGDSRNIFIDADASTGVARFDFEHLTPKQQFDLKYSGPGCPYLLRPGAKTLVIGPGGGWDVSRALASGSKDITGVEINPIIARVIMKEKFPEYSNSLYFRPEVKIEIEDGRSFVRRSAERYQVLQATLVDTWASTAAGAFALSENNLYTTNAFVDYLSHLTPDGLMSFTRWGFNPPRESLRVVALAVEALRQLGEKDPARHVAVVRENLQKLQGWGSQDTILVARQPFTAADIALIDQAAATARMEVVYVPGTSHDTPFRDLLTATGPGRFYDSYPFDVRPVSDNRPFFFYTVQPRDLWQFLKSASRQNADFKINSALPVLFGLLAISIVAMLIIMSLPPLILRQGLPRGKGVVPGLLFFLFIGAGYILIQVALIQKFVLFLGHPTYALTVIIFSMLISSGLGSYWSKSLVRADIFRLYVALAVIAGAIIGLSIIVGPIAESGVALARPIKIVLSILLISPAGFVMGMPFPTGLTLIERVMPAAVRWAWAINAASSVLGSAAAIFLAIYIGIQATLIIGGICYLAAAISIANSALNKRGFSPQLAGTVST
jgi:predicted membrane-bound spermidine synthase